MVMRHAIGALGLVALCAATSVAMAEEAKYPDLRGQWIRVGVPRWEINGQKAPLTPEYKKVFEANLADMNGGGQGNVPSWYCLPQGMPMMMNAYDPVEFVVTPDVTYVLVSHVNNSYRRVYTDGRKWPAEIEPTFAGYSIGKWVDENGDGKYDVLEVETRSIKMPHTYDATGIPFHEDGEGVIKERIYLDKARCQHHPCRHHVDRPRAHPAVDGDQDLPPRSQGEGAGLAFRGVRGRQLAGAHRRGRILHEPGRLHHADQEGPAAARPAVLQAAR